MKIFSQLRCACGVIAASVLFLSVSATASTAPSVQAPKAGPRNTVPVTRDEPVVRLVSLQVQPEDLRIEKPRRCHRIHRAGPRNTIPVCRR